MIEVIIAGNEVSGQSSSRLAAARNVGNTQQPNRVSVVPLEYPCFVLILWRAVYLFAHTYGTVIIIACSQGLDAYIYQNMVINDRQDVEQENQLSQDQE